MIRGIVLLAWSLSVTLAVQAQTPSANSDPIARFVGAPSCSSSSCHGGANTNLHQFLVWSQRDFHTRAYATLTRPRSARIVEQLGLKESPTQAEACTACHDPMQTVPPPQRAASLAAHVGVSCENCHGPAEPWLRTHTRGTNNPTGADQPWTHADRVASGLRDLKDLYVRANSCVACHQNLSADIAKAGHPELIFELDGQSVDQPRHWREAHGWSGAQSWLVGQAVALREMTAQIDQAPERTESMTNRWSGLLWLLQKSSQIDNRLAAHPTGETRPNQDNLDQTFTWSDQLARRAAELAWSPELTSKWLSALASSADEFANSKSTNAVLARRADRLVLALDRLLAANAPGQKSPPGDAELSRLFKAAQSWQDFDPKEFARQLNEFSSAIRQPKPPAQGASLR